MAQNNQQISGRSSTYKFDRGGTPVEMGPFIGTITNTVDPVRAGRVQVYIQLCHKFVSTGSPLTQSQ